MDGIALTNLRTAAVSALAVRHLATPDASRLVVFGRGPQASALVAAVRAVRPIEHVDVLGRDATDVEAQVAGADVICCCTTAREPLFDGDAVADHATVVAIGSHEPDARETDDKLATRATVVVESRVSALREAGDVILAISAGALKAEDLVTLADLRHRTRAYTPRGYRYIGVNRTPSPKGPPPCPQSPKNHSLASARRRVRAAPRAPLGPRHLGRRKSRWLQNFLIRGRALAPKAKNASSGS